MKRERIVRRTLQDRKKGRTDWERLRTMSEGEIESGASSDQDNPPWTEDELRNARLVLPANAPKVPLSIRLDREVLDFFKDQGPGYQSRIGAVLLSYVRSQKRETESRSRRSSRSSTSKKSGTAKTKTVKKRNG